MRLRTLAIVALDGRGESVAPFTVAQLLKSDGRLTLIGGPGYRSVLRSPRPVPV